MSSALEGLRRAPLYRTAAISDHPQPDFLNTAVVGVTTLPPEDLLGLAKALELAAGRRRGRRWGARPLDVDLLLYGDLVRDTPELTLPHPRLAERRFVLEPLARIAPELRVPPAGRTVTELLRAGTAVGEVTEIGWTADREGR